MLLHKKKIKIVTAIVLLLVSGKMVSQEPVNEKITNKGKFFAYWGWNRGTYSNSDIHFKGENYDFTLSDVTANDRPTKLGLNPYFRLDRITIPQTNYRIGYFFKENYTISIGADHMKYVMNEDQNVVINGSINTGSIYDKVYNNESIKLVEEFLAFEHTDGLNYINVELKRFDDFSYLFGIDSKNFQLNLTEGIGAGFLFPKSNIKLLNKERYDEFHVAGWGVSASVGVNITFLKHFFIQSDVKAGYIRMSNIRTTKSTLDSASQSFSFIENIIMFGGRFRLF
ncbi:MAG: hypothetical protein ACI9SI_001690 [Polaribacter sp.]|jgi:hypothetical protein